MRFCVTRMTKSSQVRRLLELPFLHPGLGLLSIVYTAALYGFNLLATISDIHDPFWVLTVAAIILLSPIYHAVYIRMAEAVLTGNPKTGPDISSSAVACLPALILGELLVNAAVILGGLLLVLPGIYLGTRLAFYKQAILLDGERPLPAMRESLRRTDNWKKSLSVFLLLALFYGISVGVGFALAEVPAMWLADAVGIAVSGLVLAWLNLLLTDIYIGDIPREDASA